MVPRRGLAATIEGRSLLLALVAWRRGAGELKRTRRNVAGGFDVAKAVGLALASKAGAVAREPACNFRAVAEMLAGLELLALHLFHYLPPCFIRRPMYS